MTAPGPYLAEIANLMGDPGRANMLTALMDGRALTAKELAWIAGVTPQTASGHLARMIEGGLVAVTAQGRHRYVRLAGPDVAAAIEALMALAGSRDAPRRLPSRAGDALAAARTCYDHFAGRLGISIHDALMAGGHLTVSEGGYGLSASGHDIFAALGVDPSPPGARRRAPLRPCLDWSERKPHLAGSLAAAFACRCFEMAWVVRIGGSRAVRLTEAGRAALQSGLPGFVCDEPAEFSGAPRSPVKAFA
jgi:DNA-binding transcriptional ArsR family regulator